MVNNGFVKINVMASPTLEKKMQITNSSDNSESTKQMEEKLNFQVPAEGLELVILLHTQY